MSATQYFLKKIRCCASKNNLLWQTCHNTLFFQKYCVAGMAHNAISFEKIMCCDSKSNVLWQTCHNTIFFFKKLCVVAEKMRWQIHATIVQCRPSTHRSLYICQCRHSTRHVVAIWRCRNRRQNWRRRLWSSSASSAAEFTARQMRTTSRKLENYTP